MNHFKERGSEATVHGAEDEEIDGAVLIKCFT
jgi:hypothetical protein